MRSHHVSFGLLQGNGGDISGRSPSVGHVDTRTERPALRTGVLSRHLPFWLILVLALVWALSNPRYAALAEFSFQIRPFWDNLLSEFTPWPMRCCCSSLPGTRTSIMTFRCSIHSLNGRCRSICCSSRPWRQAHSSRRRRVPLVAFGLGWFFIQLLPTSLIPRNDLLSERNLYLPAIGLLLAIVALGSHLIHWLLTIVRGPAFVRVGSVMLATALIAVLCFFTYQRNLLYQDRVLLWSDTVAKSPNKARPHNNLGYAYALRDDWDRAIEEFRTAARLDPDFILAQKNLRDAYLHHVGRP